MKSKYDCGTNGGQEPRQRGLYRSEYDSVTNGGQEPRQRGLYRSEYEHDACGVGMVANLSGEASHAIVESGLTILKRLMHRGATGNDPETGDGAGLLMRIPDGFFRTMFSFPEKNGITVGKCASSDGKAAELPPAGGYGVAMVFGGEGEEERIENCVRKNLCEVLAWREVPIDPAAIGRDARAVMPRIRQIFVVPANDGRAASPVPANDGRAANPFAARSGRAASLFAAESGRAANPFAAESGRAASPFAAESGAEGTPRPTIGADCGAERVTRPAGDSAFERRLYVLRREIEKATERTYVCSLSSRTIVYKGLLLATQIERFYPDLVDGAFESPFAIVHQRYSTNTFPSWELAHPFRAIAHNGEINAIKGNLNQLASREASLASDAFGGDIAKLLPIAGKGQSDSASLDNVFELLVAAGRDAPHAMMMLVPQAWGAKYHMGNDVRAFYEYHSALMEPWDGPAAVAFTDGRSVGAALDRNGLRPARWTLAKGGLFVLASETGVLDIPPEEVVRHGRLRPGSILWLDLDAHRIMEDAEVKTFYARRRPYRRWVKENHIPVTGLFAEIVPSAMPGAPGGADDLRRRRRDAGWTLEDTELILRPMAETGHEPVGAMGNDAALACLSKRRRTLFDHFHQLFAQVTNPPIDPIREELVMSIMTFIGNSGNILDETPGHARLVKMTRPVLTDDEMARIRNIPGFPARTLSTRYAENLEAALDALAAEAVAAAREGAKIIVLSDRGLPADGGAAKTVPSLLSVAAVHRALVEDGTRPSTGVVVESAEVREVHHFAVLLGFGATAVNPYLALATVAEIGAGDPVKASSNYVSAVCKGIMKVMSKMGISTLRSYRSARIFEAVGLGRKVMEKYFAGVSSPVGGLELEDIERRSAAAPAADPEPGGEYRSRKGGEEHLWTPQRLVDFRESVRHGDYARFHRYTDSIDNESSVTLRSRLRFREAAPVDVSEVEDAESIAKRFVGGAMSLGSLSPEAHETIALALNGLGTMSNSGEGGENPERFGTDRNSAIKQVASGRFGVTIEYLRSAKDLQIKVAQGAKPGEGGQLPAHKVDGFVASLRHAKPGTTLISPPPHHDIYSIEDLAQLIYDLKCANPEARVSVKLVSEAGVGTVAAGVAKAHADVVVVSGFDGGTGAAPLTSMKHAGLPWEPGLAEAHQTLLKNNLRGRVRLQVDGQLRTGRDIVIGAILGADEFAFGTSMLVALGCVQCRNCNLNCCPVGIATQKKELRSLFAGEPEHLRRYFLYLAEEVREILASLGLRSLEEARGRTDLLRAKDGAEDARLDFADVLAAPEAALPAHEPWAHEENYDSRELIPALPADGSSVALRRRIANRDRSVGAALSGHLAALRFAGKEPGAVSVAFEGVAGQSFGAFLARGVEFSLRGEANDYVGKSLSGGVISIAPPEALLRSPGFAAEENVVAGNVLAYGATSGKVFANGLAGERFGIRNSGAVLVAEGVGDHGCEYMTGGVALILGPVGVNFAAGMTGGVAYVYDRDGTLDLNCNLDMVDIFPVEKGSEREREVLSTMREHVERTGSPLASRLLAGWEEVRHLFAAVVPSGGKGVGEGRASARP